jgi:hypothetical protein
MLNTDALSALVSDALGYSSDVAIQVTLHEKIASRHNLQAGQHSIPMSNEMEKSRGRQKQTTAPLQ